MAAKTKKALMIVFGFPPRAGSGIQRIVKFVEFLPQNGWEPIILTIPRWGNDISDTTWEEKIPPGTRIYRIMSLDPMRILLALRFLRKAKTSINTTVNAAVSSESGIFEKLKKFYDRVSIPDSAIWWVPSAFIGGICLLIRFNPELIFTTSGPYGTSLAGLILKKISGKPWIAEFRDPWINNPQRISEQRGGKVEESMQNSCLRNVDGVIATTEPTTKEFVGLSRTKNPPISAVITNGYSEEHFPDTQTIPDAERFRIVFTGMFYGDRSPEYFFQALKECCESSEEFFRKTKVTIAGTIPKNHRQELTESPLKEIVEVLGYVSHERSIESIKHADLLYLFLSKGEADIYPAKVFEYLAVRKYILAAIPPKGITKTMIERFKAGTIIEPDDIEGHTKALLNCFDKFKNGELRVQHSLKDVEEFEWKNIVKKVAAFFETVRQTIK